MLGLKRTAIGATLGLSREGELAYITEKYTLESAEGRGVLSMYLIGTLFGSIFFSLFAPLLLNFGFDVRALGMAAGMCSASMMTAAASAVAALRPESEEIILAPIFTVSFSSCAKTDKFDDEANKVTPAKRLKPNFLKFIIFLLYCLNDKGL